MKTFANYLPQDFRLRLLFRRRLRQWSAATGVALLASLAVCLAAYADLRSARGEFDLLEADCRPIRKLREDEARVRRRLIELRQQQRQLDQLDDERLAFRVIGLVSLSAGRCAGRIQVQDLSLQPLLPPARQTGDATREPDAVVRPPARLQLHLKGIAADNVAVATFVAALRDAEVFESVDLKSSVGNQAGGATRSYVVECTFFGPSHETPSPLKSGGRGAGAAPAGNPGRGGNL